MKRTVLVTALAALSTAIPAAAAVETYTIDSRHTFPSFEVMHFGMSLQRGRFNKTTGKITVDTQAKKGTVDVTIDATSVDTGLDKLEEHVRAEDFLDASKFPTITFKGSQMTFDGDKLKSVAGELTMRGVTKPVTLNAQHFNCGIHPMNKKHMCGGEFVANIKRSEWGIKYAIPALADDMTLRINVEAYRE
jgi:polyisoprenoid-binding protein YceI